MPTIGSILGEAFDLLRTRAPAVSAWAALYALVTIGQLLFLQPIILHPPAPGQIGSFLGLFFLFYLAVLLVLLLLNAAAFRAILFPRESAYFYLRAGGDELRLLGLMLLFFVAATGATILVGIVLGVVLAVAGIGTFAAAGSANPGFGAMMGAGLLVFVLMLVVLVAFVFVWTRLSLAGPLTMLRRRIVVGEAWRLSRGHFWTLFGAYLLIFAMFFVVVMVVGLIFGGGAGTFTQMMAARANPAAMAQIQAAQQAAALSPLRIVGALINGAVGAIYIALLAGAIAAATRQLVPTAAEDVFA